MDSVTQTQWQELEARVARLEQRERGRGGEGENNASPPNPPSLGRTVSIEMAATLEDNGQNSKISERESSPQTWGVRGADAIELLWCQAPFSARATFLHSLLEVASPEWIAMLEQANALEVLQTQNGALENWLMQYPALFADVVEKLAQMPEPHTTAEQVAAELLSEVRASAESKYQQLSLTWILPKSGSPLTTECEVVGMEASAAPVGTVARCVRRGFRREGQLILAAQVTRSSGQIPNAPVAFVQEVPTPQVPLGQAESFSPALGDAFDTETMEIVGARRTAHAHEDNTVARVETPGTRSGNRLVAKAQVLVYRMGAGQ